jgi:GAF domain-containing protein
LLGFTEACYVIALAATGWHVAPAALFVRLSMLAILTVLTYFLAAELMRQMDAQREARDRAERWASLLQAVAGAARTMPLDPDGVATVVDAVRALGFETSGLCVVDEDGSSSRIQASRGLPPEFAQPHHPRTSGMVGRVLASGGTEVVHNYGEVPEAHPALRDEGLRTVVAAPVSLEGRIQAVLVGGSRSRITVRSLEQEAFELLTAQAGLALEKARR